MIVRVKYIINILIVFILFASIAIQKNGRLMGQEVSEIVFATDKSKQENADFQTETILEDGTRVINSTVIAKDVIGFGGRTPIKLYVGKGGVITQVEFLPNDETPSFFEQVVLGGLAEKWLGMSLEEAANAKIDAVSGATYSSDAIIQNVQRAAQYGANVKQTSNLNPFSDLEIKEIIGLLALLSGVLITLLKIRRKAFVIAQMAFNVIVLGFWCGSFLSLSSFVAWCSNGINLSVSMLSVLMLIIVLLMPLLGRKGSYCHIHCPMGSAQELISLAPISKIKLNQNLAKHLNNLRYYILTVLLLLMWIGVGFELMDYEVFSAFIFESASTVVLIIAAIFLLLSIFIPRPYCRFICPTGAIISMTQKASE